MIVTANCNDTVRVKLTDRGREILDAKHAEWCRDHPTVKVGPFYKEDADGYWSTQLWNMMHELGEHMQLGAMPPIEMTILLGKP